MQLAYRGMKIRRLIRSLEVPRIPSTAIIILLAAMAGCNNAANNGAANTTKADSPGRGGSTQTGGAAANGLCNGGKENDGIYDTRRHAENDGLMGWQMDHRGRHVDG